MNTVRGIPFFPGYVKQYRFACPLFTHSNFALTLLSLSLNVLNFLVHSMPTKCISCQAFSHYPSCSSMQVTASTRTVLSVTLVGVTNETFLLILVRSRYENAEAWELVIKMCIINSSASALSQNSSPILGASYAS